METGTPSFPGDEGYKIFRRNPSFYVLLRQIFELSVLSA